MEKTKVNLVVAVGPDNGIGHQNKISWPRIGLDVEYFSKITAGSDLIMGRKALQSFSELELKSITEDRRLIIVSNNLEPHEVPDNSTLAPDFKSAMKLVKAPQVFLTGGFGIYWEALKKNLVHTMYRTRVHNEFKSDVYFPSIGEEWVIESQGEKLVDPKSKITVSFDVLKNINNPFKN